MSDIPLSPQFAPDPSLLAEMEVVAKGYKKTREYVRKLNLALLDSLMVSCGEEFRLSFGFKPTDQVEIWVDETRRLSAFVSQHGDLILWKQTGSLSTTVGHGIPLTFAVDVIQAMARRLRAL